MAALTIFLATTSGVLPAQPVFFRAGDFRAVAFPRLAGENLEANRSLVDELAAIATEVGAEPAQVALAWVLSRGDDVVPIPGTKRRRWLEQNAAAC